MPKQDDLILALERINAELKETKSRVSIIIKSGWFYFRATLPPRDDITEKPKSQYIATHISASKSNITAVHSLAETLALDIKIWKRFHGNSFNWDNWKSSRTPSSSPKPKSELNDFNLLDLWILFRESCQNNVTPYYYSNRLMLTDQILIKCINSNPSCSSISNPSLSLEVKSTLLEITTSKQTKAILIQLNACCKWGLENKFISINPFLEASKSISINSKEVIFPFTKEERDRIISSFESAYFHKLRTMIQIYYTPYVKFCFFTGCRPSEAVGLHWNHITDSHIIFQQVVLKIDTQYHIQDHLKTQKFRKFPINNQLLTILNNQKIIQK